ncbi:MAG: redoxin domain-containing protein [Balneola sp.]
MHLVKKEAPEFTLKNTNGEDVSLSEYRSKKNVVLLFFPLAFTSTCTKELCETRDNLKVYNSLEAEILGISVDSFFTLKEFKQSQNLNFQLLSDFNREVSEQYGVLYQDFFGMKGVAKRSVFIINKEGVVVHSEVLEDASELPNFNKMISTLSELD